MSKEMSLIVLGVFVIVVPYLGVPGSWRTLLLVVSGAAIAILGFLLRGEALAGGMAPGRHATFVDSLPAQPGAPSESASSAALHEHKEGITSLN